MDRVLKFRTRLSPERLLEILRKMKGSISEEEPVAATEETKVSYHSRVF